MAIAVAAAGFAKIFAIRINSAAAEEALMFSRLVKNEIRFKNAPYSVLAETKASQSTPA